MKPMKYTAPEQTGEIRLYDCIAFSNIEHCSHAK